MSTGKLKLPSTIFLPPDIHPSTAKTIVTMSVDLAEKLYKSQVKYGLDRGWRYPPSTDKGVGSGRFFMNREECVDALINHINKGDHIDVIAYVMFMRDMGWELPTLKRTI